jgi:hypothetical protein
MNPNEYRVKAHNTATASENKIHDDGVARRFGFRGGLVPGVDVYAYLTHPLVERWGRAWLERGSVAARFHKPVYDGEDVLVVARDAPEGSIEIEVRNPAGDLCAAARATLPEQTPAAPDVAAYPPGATPDEPPPASPESLAAGRILGSFENGFHADRAGEYLADVRETLPIYGEERVAHPGYLLRNANWILVANVKLGPWIHVGSEVQNFSAARDGERIATRGRVQAAYEKKGHRFVDLDLVMLADATRPLLRVLHTAIYQPRQAA